VPIVVLAHEDRAGLPSCGCLFEHHNAFVETTVGLEDVGQGVLRPGLGGIARERLAGGFLGGMKLV
jgi:hypothetical protein